jgi:hypothetical protein
VSRAKRPSFTSAINAIEYEWKEAASGGFFFSGAGFTKLETSVESLKAAIEVLTERNEAAAPRRQSRRRFLGQTKARTP